MVPGFISYLALMTMSHFLILVSQCHRRTVRLSTWTVQVSSMVSLCSIFGSVGPPVRDATNVQLSHFSDSPTALSGFDVTSSSCLRVWLHFVSSSLTLFTHSCVAVLQNGASFQPGQFRCQHGLPCPSSTLFVWAHHATHAQFSHFSASLAVTSDFAATFGSVEHSCVSTLQTHGAPFNLASVRGFCMVSCLDCGCREQLMHNCLTFPIPSQLCLTLVRLRV